MVGEVWDCPGRVEVDWEPEGAVGKGTTVGGLGAGGRGVVGGEEVVEIGRAHV